VAILVAFMLVLFCGLAALVVDLGIARDLQRQAQNAADSGTLGAAEFLAGVPNPTAAQVMQAQQLANAYVTANGWAAGTSSVLVDTAAHTVMVQLAPVQSPNIFAGVIGQSSPQVAGRAQAAWPGAGPVTCSVCVLSAANLQNGSIAVTGGGGVSFASDLSANPQGNMTVTGGGTIGVAGAQPGRGTYSPAITSIPTFTDPYAGLTLPPTGTDFSQPVQTPAAGAFCSPGNYADVANCGSFQAGGTYVLTGSAKLTGNATLVADDVLFYFTCSRVSGGNTYPQACAAGGQAGATFGGAGNGTVTINGLRSGPYTGFAVIYDRNNTSSLRYVGNGDLRINGAVYAAAAAPDMRGNGSADIHGALIVGSLSFSGRPSALTVTQYDVTPPPPANSPQTPHLTQ
jgi:Flp pilus assembly protein TadG